ncbi:MAG: Ig-like domain-containing protein [Candidatus Kryptoniota bacterium]
MMIRSFELPVAIISAIFLLNLLAGCAGQIPPSGGPIDTAPPKILYSSPAFGEKNFHSQEIIIRFDKYMSERTVESAIYFPPYKLSDLTFDWSGKELKIKLAKPLQQGRTYILTIGATATDLRNNKLGHGINLVFSTGDEIDTCSIAGNVYSSQRIPFTISAYPLSMWKDTLNPSQVLAPYVTQTDDSGRYVLNGLAKGVYRLICFDDQLRNFVYAKQTDLYSSADRDFAITPDSCSLNNVDFVPVMEDTTRPQLFSASIAQQGCVVLKFSKAIDSSSVHKENFSIEDSARNISFPVSLAMRLESTKYEVLLYPQFPLAKGKYIISVNKMVKDLSGNEMDTKYSKTILSVDSSRSVLQAYNFSFQDSSRGVTGYDTLFCQYIPFVDSSLTQQLKISLEDSSGMLIENGLIRKDSLIWIVSNSVLNPGEWYRLKLKFRLSDKQTRDSVVSRYFQTISRTSAGDLAGRVITKLKGKEVVVTAMARNGRLFYTQAEKDGQFVFSNLPEGDYFISAYIRHGSSWSHFSGHSYPFEFSEPYGVFPEPVKVRPRWTTEGVIIKLH